MRFDSCFCTNSICTPSRAAILTGTDNHVNGVTTLDHHLDDRLTTFPRPLRDVGDQTAVFGNGISVTGRHTIQRASTRGGCCPAKGTTTIR